MRIAKGKQHFAECSRCRPCNLPICNVFQCARSCIQIERLFCFEENGQTEEFFVRIIVANQPQKRINHRQQEKIVRDARFPTRRAFQNVVGRDCEAHHLRNIEPGGTVYATASTRPAQCSPRIEKSNVVRFLPFLGRILRWVQKSNSVSFGVNDLDAGLPISRIRRNASRRCCIRAIAVAFLSAHSIVIGIYKVKDRPLNSAMIIRDSSSRIGPRFPEPRATKESGLPHCPVFQAILLVLRSQ